MMPLFHVHGLIGCLFSTMASKGSLYLTKKFSVSNFLDEISFSQCTWTSGVPTMYHLIVEKFSLEELSILRTHLRLVRCCSSPLREDLEEKIKLIFSWVQFRQAYGMTEAFHQVLSSNDSSPKGSLGNVKDSLLSIKIFNDEKIGEILLDGENVIQDYVVPNADSFVLIDNRRWFRTGDLGHIDSNGNLFLKGRLKEEINRGGEKIFPLDIEEAINKVTQLDTVCLPVSDPIYGQVVGVAIHGKSLDIESLNFSLLKFIPKFKLPSVYIFLDTFPLLPNGKIDRKRISRLLHEAK